MKETENHPENSGERKVVTGIKRLHTEFLQKVPNYEKKKWDPRQSLRDKSGSCMSELLYIAGGLLADGSVSVEDLFIGFSKDHGESYDIGFVGKTGKKYAHTFLLITAGDVTLEADFRANRADEEPRIQRLQEDEIDNNEVYVGPIMEAITQYARIEGSTGPSLSELIALHLGDETLSKPSYELEEEQIRFDEDF